MSNENEWRPASPWSYRPSPHEADWLDAALSGWMVDGTLSDVLFSVRGGKEASVYACRSGAPDYELVAAKVYRPRKFRELSNDAIYREGRGLLDDQGHGVRARDRRMGRAVRKRTRIGKQASHVSWVMHEVHALRTLRGAGAHVPEVFAANTRAVVMDFVGDDEGAAPTLHRLRPDPALARQLYDQLLHDVETMLGQGIVHGDLSPYNVLVWNDEAVIIDLPQAVDVTRNPHGPRLFLRDVERICTAPSLGRPEPDFRVVADEIWDRVFDGGGVPDGPVW